MAKAIALCTIALAGVGGPASTAGTPTLEALSIDPPAVPGSTLPTLAVEVATTISDEPHVLMTWLAPHESGGRLMFARLSGAVWSQPITVAEGISELAGDDQPSLTVIDTRAVRRTLIARTGDVVARSGNAGRTWSRLPGPPLPFSSFAGGDEGAYVFWLTAAGDGAARLLGTRVLAGETLLDPIAAEGPGTSAVMTWDGPVVAYRDRNLDGEPAIGLVRRQDAQWTPPFRLTGEGLGDGGTPVGSPKMATLQRQVALAWHARTPTGARVLVAFSSDAGRTFGAPVEVDATQGDRAPHSLDAIALDENGDALVLWTATAPAGVELMLARVTPDGGRGQEAVVAGPTPTRPPSGPQMARAGDRVAVSWTEGAPGRVRAVTVPLAGLPAAAGGRPDAVSAPPPAPGPYRGRGRVGESVPGTEFSSLAGERVSLASLRGRAVLLNLWATWCLPCLAEMPELSAIHERYADRGLVVVGASADSSEAIDQVRSFVSEHLLPFDIWLDPDMRLADTLQVRALPATFVIDREGQILLRLDRAIEPGDTELAGALDRALGDSEPD